MIVPTEKRCVIIAEAGVNHNGDLGMAKELVRQAAEAGADYVKFQTFSTDKLVTRTAKQAAYQKQNLQSGDDDSQYNMLKKLELSHEDHYELIKTCNYYGIRFLSTAFDNDNLVFLMKELNLDCIKIPSGELTNYPYLRLAAQLDKPIILSTGMAVLDEIIATVDLLEKFRDQPKTLQMPVIPSGSFAKKLYSTYLSYLPKEKVAFDLKMNCDARGSFTELLKTADCGQFSVNISNPGITKGQHWHNSKWEFFIVVSGHGLIQERKIGSDEVIEFEVTGEKIQAIHMLPGYTHNIINLSNTEPLVTLMWANEQFDPNRPDTFGETV